MIDLYINLIVLLISILLTGNTSLGQNTQVEGEIKDEEDVVPFASIIISGEKEYYGVSDEAGYFLIEDIIPGKYNIKVDYIGYQTYKDNFDIKNDEKLFLDIYLEPEDIKLDEVVITGISKEASLHENPYAISTLNSQAISLTSESNIINILAKNTPGLSVVQTGPNISKPFIRGLGYNRVLILYDRVRQEGQQWGDEHGLEVDNYNVDRVEIIKGPSSIMYGSDALAGVVSFFSKIPRYNDNKIHGNIISEYQTNNGLLGSGFRLEYNNERVILAGRGSFRMAQNYRNPVDGRVYLTNFQEKNISALIGIKSERGENQLNFTYYDNLQGIPDGSRDSITRKFTKQIYEDDLDSDENRPIVSTNELKSYKIPDLSQRINHYRLFLYGFYQYEKGDLDYLMAVQQNIRREFNHPTQTSKAGMNVKLNTLNYSVRFQPDKIIGTETSIGLNGMLQNNTNLEATEFPIPDYMLFDIGSYLFLKWKKKDFTISGGFRYDIRVEKWDDFYIGVDSLTGFSQKGSSEDLNSELTFPEFRKSFHDFSVSLGSTYKILDYLNIKGNIGKSFRAPNIAELASNGLDPGAHIYYLGDTSFTPEISLQYDLGIHFDYEQFQLEISLFHNKVNNYVFLNAVADEKGVPIVDNQGNRTYKYQQTKARLVGGELFWSYTPKWFNNVKYEGSFSFVRGTNISTEYKGEKTNGEFLPLIPPLKLRSDFYYENINIFSFISKFSPNLGFEINGKQSRFFGLNGTESATPSYVLVNLGFDSVIPISKENNVSFVFQINNIFNSAYQSHLSRLKYFEDYADGSGIYGMGRNFTIKTIFAF